MKARYLILKFRYLALKLFKLSLGEWRDLFAAQGAIVSAQVLVWLRRRGSLVSAEPSVKDGTSHAPIDPAVLNLARAIDRSASFGLIRAQCLVRSIALSRLMAARGFDGAVVRVGVSRIDEKMLAHAWVDYKGAVVGDDEEYVSQFDQLPGIDVDI